MQTRIEVTTETTMETISSSVSCFVHRFARSGGRGSSRVGIRSPRAIRCRRSSISSSSVTLSPPSVLPRFVL